MKVAPGRIWIEMDTDEYERMRDALGHEWEFRGMVRIREGKQPEHDLPDEWKREVSKLLLRLVQHVDTPALGRAPVLDVDLSPIMRAAGE